MCPSSSVLNHFDNKYDKQFSDGRYSRQLSLLMIVGQVFNIICTGSNEWEYDYELHNMKRNDSLW